MYGVWLAGVLAAGVGWADASRVQVLAKEIAAQRGGPWLIKVSVQKRDYVSAILEAKMALGKAHDALAKAALRMDGHPLAPRL